MCLCLYKRYIPSMFLQVVTMDLSMQGSNVQVQYYDAETFCEGFLDVQRCSLKGDVKQLVNGEEGFFYPAVCPCLAMRERATSRCEGIEKVACYPISPLPHSPSMGPLLRSVPLLVGPLIGHWWWLNVSCHTLNGRRNTTTRNASIWHRHRLFSPSALALRIPL